MLIPLISSEGTGEQVLFWPAILPQFDGHTDDPIGLIEQLGVADKVVLFPSLDFPSFRSLAVVNEVIPPHIAPYCTLVQTIDSLAIRGCAYYSDAEWLFGTDARTRAKYPHLCQKIEIPEGCYDVSLFTVSMPKNHFRRWIKERIGRRACLLWDLYGVLALISLFAIVAFLFGLLSFRWTVGRIAFTASSLFVALTALIGKTAGYRAGNQAMQDYALCYPAYVVVLTTR